MPWVRELLMRMFGRPKGVLGRLGGVIMARVNRDAAAQVIEVLDVRPDDKVLEVGFGPVSPFKCCCIAFPPDPSLASISRRKWSGRRRPATRTHCEAAGRTCATVQSRGYRSFDKALAINSMQAWPDARAALREIRRVLKHGGNVALGFTVNSGQPKEGVAELLAAASFAQPRIVDKSKLFCAIATRP